MDIKNRIPTSQEDYYCEGFLNNAGGYLLGIYLSAAKQKIKMSHPGSRNLDEINAFDLAEVNFANLGQTNMIKVSSFCGPKGLIWGLDAAKTPLEKICEVGGVAIYNIRPLQIAFKKLIGTIEKPRFPFLPGSHVPCAYKSHITFGEKIIYSALALGIPEDRKKQACLLMEDIGEIPLSYYNINKNNVKKNIIRSVFEIGKNQKIRYNMIFIGYEDIFVNKGEVGCALVASPYFTIAKKAIHASFEANQTLIQWEKHIFNQSL